MDLNLYMRVLWRFRVLVAVGALLASLTRTTFCEAVSFEGGPPPFSIASPRRGASTVTIS